ncbi:MAG: hypothetical protein H7Y27_06335 [Gemmatimonadaceae bacterium]|nr:hypothetical protein [Chitinophagaceae bacterium]
MKILRLAIPAIILISFSSCHRYYYKPNAVNTPLFTEGGQAHLNLAGSFGGESDGTDYSGNTYFFDVQGSVSPIKHLGIIANYSTWAYRADNPEPVGGNVDADAHLLEVGVGGYYAAGKGKFKLITDIYGGFGAGQLKSDVNMRINRFFLQPGIGIRSPWFDAAFNLRMVHLRYSDFNANGRTNDYLIEHELIDVRGRRIDQRNYVFAEPAITLRGGYKFAKVQLQAVFANEVNNVPWNYNGARFTAGFYFSLEDALKPRQ